MKKFFVTAVLILLILSVSLTGCGILEELDVFQKSTSTVGTENQTDKKNKISTKVSRIYYNTLDEGKKKAYDNIYKGIMDLKEKFYVSESYSSDEVFDLLYYVLNDNPEIFWAHGTSVFSSDGTMKLDYNLSAEEIAVKTKALRAKADQLINTIHPVGDDYSKALAIFDYIAENTTYSMDAKNEKKGIYNPAYTLDGVLIDSLAVCEGYTKAYQYLLSLAGISSTLIAGESNGSSHAWLLVELDGERYYSDVTWADQTESTTTVPHIDHFYFAMNSEQLLKNHTIDRECDLFKCTATADNYYVREDVYFTSFDFDTVLNACKALEEKSGKGYIEFYISDEDEYKAAMSSLVDDLNAAELGKKVLGKKCTSYEDNKLGYLILF